MNAFLSVPEKNGFMKLLPGRWKKEGEHTFAIPMVICIIFSLFLKRIFI